MKKRKMLVLIISSIVVVFSVGFIIYLFVTKPWSEGDELEDSGETQSKSDNQDELEENPYVDIEESGADDYSDTQIQLEPKTLPSCGKDNSFKYEGICFTVPSEVDYSILSVDGNDFSLFSNDLYKKYIRGEYSADNDYEDYCSEAFGFNVYVDQNDDKKPLREFIESYNDSLDFGDTPEGICSSKILNENILGEGHEFTIGSGWEGWSFYGVPCWEGTQYIVWVRKTDSDKVYQFSLGSWMKFYNDDMFCDEAMQKLDDVARSVSAVE